MTTRQQVALVTGATRGIGRAIAAGLVAEGVTVLVGARDRERGERVAAEITDEIGNGIGNGIGAATVGAVAIDVTDRGSIEAAAASVRRRYGRLDVLVNNAGVNVGYQRPSEVDADAMRRVYETNVFGVVSTIHTFLPLLAEAPAGRIVNVSGTRGSIGEPRAWGGRPSMPYSSSKTALNAVTVHYARELADGPIKVNAVCPGHVATDFNDHTGARTPEQGAAIAIRMALLGDDGPTGAFVDDDGPIAW